MDATNWRLNRRKQPFFVQLMMIRICRSNPLGIFPDLKGKMFGKGKSWLSFSKVATVLQFWAAPATFARILKVYFTHKQQNINVWGREKMHGIQYIQIVLFQQMRNQPALEYRGLPNLSTVFILYNHLRSISLKFKQAMQKNSLSPTVVVEHPEQWNLMKWTV